jgi:hypothetical protein
MYLGKQKRPVVSGILHTLHPKMNPGKKKKTE